MFSNIKKFFSNYFYKKKNIIDDEDSSLEDLSISSIENVVPDIEISDDDSNNSNLFENNSNELVKSIITFAEIYLKSNSISKCRKEIEKNFNIDNLQFIDARYIDYTLLKKGGPFWVNAYNFPSENQTINGLTAINVGLFTFQLV